MITNDPTSMTPAAFIALRGDIEYTVDEIALLQAQASENGEEAVKPAVAAEAVHTRTVSGRYKGRSANGEIELELRIDVDGRRPMRRVSGDFYRTVGDTVTYLGSFIVNTPTLSTNEYGVVIDGQGSYTFQIGSPRLQISIDKVGQFSPAPIAVAQFMTPEGVHGARYSCDFQSTFFRRVEFETDFVMDVQPFASYDTSLLPSGGPVRSLSVTAAFAEAGIEMVDTGGANEVPLELAGTDRIWTNRELHASMENHFRLWRNDPGWRVWMLAATIHEVGQGLRGIMFDLEGSQRQGCAVFHDVIGGSTNQVVRAQLRTYVHELGHCFNLCHSHQKEYMRPPQPNRMDALSWMHYPDYYRSTAGAGSAAYWAAFPFQFDDQELIHLRHAFRNDIIMGGNPFGKGAADVDPLLFADPIEDRSGLRFTIRSSKSYYFGEPVVLELKLETTDTRGNRVNSRIHPNHGYVQVAISKPGGRVVVYRPFLQQCTETEMVDLDESNMAVYDSAYIGYGKDGLYFGEPGLYGIRAVYHAVDGSKVFSNVLQLRVDAPASKEENEIANLFLGEEQGKLLYLLGSDADGLTNGRNAFQQVIDQFSYHPMAVYAKMVKGMNASRPFKMIDSRKREIQVRQTQLEESSSLLSDVFDTMASAIDPTAEVGIDNITLNMVSQSLVKLQKEQGDVEKAKQTAQKMLGFSMKRNFPKWVQDKIKKEMGNIIDPEK